MALDMSTQQKELGKQNFRLATKELSRRGFLKGLLGGAAALPVAAAAYYGYQYEKLHGKPVRTALIGAGDEGGVLIGEHNPKYLEFVAYSDIRPYNQKRIFEGEKAPSPRKGFNFHYGNDAEKKIKKFDDYKALLADNSYHRPPAPLQLALRPGVGSHQGGNSRRHQAYPGAVASQQLLAQGR